MQRLGSGSAPGRLYPRSAATDSRHGMSGRMQTLINELHARIRTQDFDSNGGSAKLPRLLAAHQPGDPSNCRAKPTVEAASKLGEASREPDAHGVMHQAPYAGPGL
jgi:hypothetical protein